MECLARTVRPTGGGRLTGVLFHGVGEWELLQVNARRKYAD
ncbi:MAG TPA: hypothetical protein VGR02_20705 [Thermoanaerobaculia bacterium]|jgi:hypothetical protein|nr:hypothetical protein [Thermoanaerobaculia bacterium]